MYTKQKDVQDICVRERKTDLKICIQDVTLFFKVKNSFYILLYT